MKTNPYKGIVAFQEHYARQSRKELVDLWYVTRCVKNTHTVQIGARHYELSHKVAGKVSRDTIHKRIPVLS